MDLFLPPEAGFQVPFGGGSRGGSQESLRLPSQFGEGWEGKSEQPRSGFRPPLPLLPCHREGGGGPALRKGAVPPPLKTACHGDWSWRGPGGRLASAALPVPFFSQLLGCSASCAPSRGHHAWCCSTSLPQLLQVTGERGRGWLQGGRCRDSAGVWELKGSGTWGGGGSRNPSVTHSAGRSLGWGREAAVCVGGLRKITWISLISELEGSWGYFTLAYPTWL